MRAQRELRCLIAAGGTAGHVLPALAVADALRARGVSVTFAGSPDRAEARLVPEAGYELDTFRISGLPRRPSAELVRALLLAGRAPRACLRILARRRPDVVLGGGGYVAGPMVVAARRRRIPAALTELAVDAFGAEGPTVLHVSGERDFASLEPRVSRPDYHLIPSTDRFGAALGAIDLALSRAGGTVWELAAAGVPAVLVPYPHATGDHQFLNASYFEGSAVVVRESELDRVPPVVRELLADADRLRAMGEAMRGRARPDAAETIAEELVALAA